MCLFKRSTRNIYAESRRRTLEGNGQISMIYENKAKRELIIEKPREFRTVS